MQTGAILGLAALLAAPSVIAADRATSSIASNAWAIVVPNTAPMSAPEPDQRLTAVNNHYNAYRPARDAELWGRQDYWATQREFERVQAGDCEDFAIAKYFRLLEEGIPEDRLRLVIARLWRPRERMIELHVVLVVFDSAGADPLVLDNVDSEILPLSQRLDLHPLLVFDRRSAWKMNGRSSTGEPVSLPERWADLLARMASESSGRVVAVTQP